MFNKTLINEFYDRNNELATLNRLWKATRREGQLVLLHGRRRTGKTFLTQRFASQLPEIAKDAAMDEPVICYYLADQTNEETQRLDFATNLLEALTDDSVPSPSDIANSWNAFFRYITTSLRTSHEKKSLLMIIDEFPYLVEKTPELPSILQSWWDREGIRLPVMIILCGSHLSAMQALGYESAPLFGRFGAKIQLRPMEFEDIAKFYADYDNYTLRDKLVMYGIFGGTPRYHAMIDRTKQMEDEIVDILLRSASPLENEISYLLSSDQVRDPSPYNAILAAIANGNTQFSTIKDHSKVEQGNIGYYLNILIDLGWIERERPFDAENDRRAQYKIADPFVSFYYYFVTKLMSRLHFENPKAVYEKSIAPYLPTYMGRVFEPVCTQWTLRHLNDTFGISISNLGRYWSRDGQIEIDIVANLPNDEYLFGECKWSETKPIGFKELIDLRTKVERLPSEKYRHNPTFVLYSLGGFSPELKSLAKSGEEKLLLIGPEMLLPN